MSDLWWDSGTRTDFYLNAQIFARRDRTRSDIYMSRLMDRGTGGADQGSPEPDLDYWILPIF